MTMLGARRPRPPAARPRAARRRATSSCRLTASARCRPTTATGRSSSGSTGTRDDRRLRARGVHDRACSAATPTGAGRSGSPSTTSCIGALTRFARRLGDELTVEFPPGSGQQLHAARRSATTSPQRLVAIFLRRTTAGARCSAARTRFQRRPRVARRAAVPRVLPRRRRRRASAPRTRPAGPAWSPTWSSGCRTRASGSSG